MRYKGIKGKFWAIFSEYIRKRDVLKYGTCISCGRRFGDWTNAQAGHYAPAGNCGFALLFSEDNVHAECPYDNAFNSGHLINYKNNLEKRYGKAWLEDLEDRYNASRYRGVSTKVWSNKQYEEKIKEYEEKIRGLETL